MFRSFGQITWRAVGAANQARKKERTLGNQSGGGDEAQGPLGVVIDLKGIQARESRSTITEVAMLCTPPGTAGTEKGCGLQDHSAGEGRYMEAAMRQRGDALGMGE